MSSHPWWANRFHPNWATYFHPQGAIAALAAFLYLGHTSHILAKGVGGNMPGTGGVYRTEPSVSEFLLLYVGAAGFPSPGLSGWYIMAAYRWYTMAAQGWYTIAEHWRYTDGRILTPGHPEALVACYAAA
jgi:hypothetical protein